ncbi:MAG: hypothetical protein LC775_04210 [Acidobacteria bacterium]|nr:hypothetical protein [Acidobacteriota bacterium]
MAAETIALIAGAAFILIAIIGGGFTVKELTIPAVPWRGRLVSGIVGVFFIAYSLTLTLVPLLPGESPPNAGGPPPSAGGETAIYTDDLPSVSNDNVRVSGLRAISEHNPPQVNDRIKIQFRLGLREGAVEPVVLGYTFTGARNPANANKDFGEGNYEKILTPHESLDIESTILVAEEGVWSFWPCYAIGNTFCPDEWRAFQVAVVKMP